MVVGIPIAMLKGCSHSRRCSLGLLESNLAGNSTFKRFRPWPPASRKFACPSHNGEVSQHHGSSSSIAPRALHPHRLIPFARGSTLRGGDTGGDEDPKYSLYKPLLNSSGIAVVVDKRQ